MPKLLNLTDANLMVIGATIFALLVLHFLRTIANTLEHVNYGIQQIRQQVAPSDLEIGMKIRRNREVEHDRGY